MLRYLALFLSLTACASSPSIRAAEAGQFAGLSKKVASEVTRGSFDAADAEAIAFAVASGEARRANGAEGVATIRALQSCARHVSGALEDRSAREDEAGAAAAFVRIEEGLESAESFAGRTASESAAWRAVGARGLIGEHDGDKRRKLTLDGDQGIRFGALRAAVIAADAGDLEAVLEAARLDPFPLARREAIRAAGIIGGERSVLALKDLWVFAEAPDRAAITEAWASPRSLIAGGRRELSWASDTQTGVPGIAAAWALVRIGGAGAEDATGVIERAIADGPSQDRAFAILIAPLGEARLERAIVAAVKDHDDAIAIGAMSRRLERLGSDDKIANLDRAAIVARLLELAKGAEQVDADGQSTNVSERAKRLAKHALAAGHVQQARAILEADVMGSDTQARAAAAEDLAELGDLPYAAIAAVDADVHTRLATSCAILNATARRR